MNKDEREQIFNKYIHLIDRCINRYFSKSKDKDDLFQVGAIFLLKSIDNFDEKIGNNFESYAVTNIRYGIYNYNNKNKLGINSNHNAVNAIYSCIKSGEENGNTIEEMYNCYNSKPRVPKLDKYTFEYLYNIYHNNYYNLDETDLSSDVDFEEMIVEKLTEEHIIDIAKSTVDSIRMSDRNRNIYVDYIKIILESDDEWGVLSELSKKYGLTRERIRQIVKTVNILFSNRLKKEEIL